MRDLKKILKLRASNKSQRFIADSLKISRNTVSRIFSLADQKQLYWEKNIEAFWDICRRISDIIPSLQRKNLCFIWQR